MSARFSRSRTYSVTARLSFVSMRWRKANYLESWSLYRVVTRSTTSRKAQVWDFRRAARRRRSHAGHHIMTDNNAYAECCKLMFQLELSGSMAVNSPVVSHIGIYECVDGTSKTTTDVVVDNRRRKLSATSMVGPGSITAARTSQVISTASPASFLDHLLSSTGSPALSEDARWPIARVST